MRVSVSHNRDEIFARRFFLVLSHFDLTLSQHRGILFFFFFLWGQVECISRRGKCQGLRDPGSCTRFDYGRFFACFLSLLMRRKLMPTGTEAVEMSNFYCVLLRCSVAGMWEVLN